MLLVVVVPVGIVSSMLVGDDDVVGHKSSSVADAETGDKEGDGNAEFGLSITPRFSMVASGAGVGAGAAVVVVVQPLMEEGDDE